MIKRSNQYKPLCATTATFKKSSATEFYKNSDCIRKKSRKKILLYNTIRHLYYSSSLSSNLCIQGVLPFFVLLIKEGFFSKNFLFKNIVITLNGTFFILFLYRFAKGRGERVKTGCWGNRDIAIISCINTLALPKRIYLVGYHKDYFLVKWRDCR